MDLRRSPISSKTTDPLSLLRPPKSGPAISKPAYFSLLLLFLFYWPSPETGTSTSTSTLMLPAVPATRIRQNGVCWVVQRCNSLGYTACVE
jgi:hypothetical protein